MPEIKVHLQSDLLGSAFEHVFPAGRVVVGRRGDCDLVLDSRHTQASGHHLAIEWEAGHLVLEDLGSTNGTTVNGQLVTKRTPLAPGDRVVIGPEGPVLAAEIVGQDFDLLDTIDGEGLDLERTVEMPAGGPILVPETDVRAIVEGSFGPVPAVVAEPPPPPQLPPMIEPRVQLRPVAPMADPTVRRSMEPAPASAGEDQPRKSVGLETMTSMVRAATRQERRRGYVVVALALALGGAGFYVLRRDAVDAAELEAIRSETGRLVADAQLDRPVQDDFQAVLASVAESVYVVIKRTERDGDSSRVVESGSGTAWSIREGFLGTNGHVADLFASLGPGETLVARSNASPPVDLRITGVSFHPGYAGFTSLIDRIRPYDKSSSEVLDLPPAYDVALLAVNPADVSRQAPPLALASDETVYALQSGQPIAFVGFPAEGLVRGGTDLARPSAKTAIGSINRVIDPFFGRAEDVSLAHCLEYNIEVVGGASGSPIVNASGEVIGLINAGDVLSQTANGRVGTGGTSYGPRVDTIRALVDGEGEAEWQDLLPKIRARMLEIFRDGSLEAQEHAGQVGTVLLDSIARTLALNVEHKFSWTFKGEVQLDRSGLAGREFFEVPAGPSGLRAIIAIAEGSPLGIRMEGRGRQDRERLVDRPSDSELPSTVDVRIINPTAADGPIRLDFRASADEYFAPGRVAVFVLRLD